MATSEEGRVEGEHSREEGRGENRVERQGKGVPKGGGEPKAEENILRISNGRR